MFGEKRELTTMQCGACGRWIAVRVDPEDVARMRTPANPCGVLAQDCFVDRAGGSYLTADERELFIPQAEGGGTCVACWNALCPSNRLDYN
jgi:hypothetical protein